MGKKHLAHSVSRISIFKLVTSMFSFRIFLEFAGRGFNVSPNRAGVSVFEQIEQGFAIRMNFIKTIRGSVSKRGSKVVKNRKLIRGFEGVW